jgi:hypothetical protein
MSNITHLQALREDAQAQAREHELLADQSPDNIFYRLTYEQATARAEGLRLDIIAAQQQREQEIVEVRLIGKSAVHGTLPLDTLSLITGAFSDTIQRISRYTIAGAKQNKKLEDEVHRRLDLRLASVASGSTRLFISGQTHPDLFGYSLLNTAFERTFDLLEAPAPAALLEQVPTVGHHSIIALKRYLKGLHDCGLEAEMRWDTPSETFRSWYGDKRRLVSLGNMLGRVETEAPITLKFTGTVISLSLKGVVELADDQLGPLKAHYFDALLPAIQRVHVGQQCQGTLIKQTLVHTTTNLRRASYTLGSITARES